jgi:nondiscriminating aspartyl-tRNA synthetase
MRVLSSELANHDGATVECAGWVRSNRELAKLVFFTIADRSGRFQAIVKDPALVPAAKNIGLEDVVWLKGIAHKNEKVKEGGVELEVTQLAVLATADRKLPVDVAGKTESSFETRFDHRVLDLRGERRQAIFNVRNTICQAFREYLVSQDFIEIHTPKIIATGTEGGANLFPVVYFGREAFLAQSPQFYKQMLVGAGFERVFEVAPVYRAEEHDTPFHLNEYISLDLEFGFINNEEDVMKVTAGVMESIFKRVIEQNQKDLEYFKADLQVPKLPMPIVRYWEIPKIMESMGKAFPDPMADLGREHEEALCAWAKEKHGSDFVFIDHYPASKRPAYTMPYEQDARFTRGYDLLYRGLEIVTGGQRIHNYTMLWDAFVKKGYRPEDFEFYFEVFKYGMPPHGGQAAGLERLTMKILGLDNVREASFFPRDKKRLSP